MAKLKLQCIVLYSLRSHCRTYEDSLSKACLIMLRYTRRYNAVWTIALQYSASYYLVLPKP